MGKALTAAIRAASETGQQPLRAVDYLRVSTEEQAKGYGITYTGKRTVRHITKKGWDHVGTYADEGLSGSLESQDRPDLNRLMGDVAKQPRPFDMVVVNEGRVIGRTGRAFWRWVWELEDLGVFVAVVKDDYDNSIASGRSKMRKDADYAEEERENIRTRTQGGIQEAAEDGLYPGGTVPFGWTVEDGKYVVNKRDAKTLHKGRKTFLASRSWQKVALTLNAEKRFTQSGRPWTRKNARRVFLGDAVMRNRVVWRGKQAARRADGTNVFGDQVVIKLPKIFSKKEAAELRDAAESPVRAPRAQGRVYILSGLLVSPCGQVYRGHNQHTGVFSYRCKGREEKYAGAGGTCACPALDVGPIEEQVWNDVCELLGDAERMKAMAQDWIGAVAGEHVDHVSRIAQLDQQIAEQSQVINATMAVAARQAASRGLPDAEVEAAAEAAIRPLTVDLVGLEKLRGEASAWQRDAEEASNRARDFERLAEAARANLGDLTPELQAELLELLELQAKVIRCAPKRRGVACKVTDWFTSRGRDVPTLTDQGWARVEPLLAPRRGSADRRPVLEALLHKARTGARFKDMAGEYGNPASLQTQATRWMNSGAWGEAMELLKDEPGSPAWRPDPIEIRVSLRPLAIESNGGDRERGGWRTGRETALQLTFMTAA